MKINKLFLVSLLFTLPSCQTNYPRPDFKIKLWNSDGVGYACRLNDDGIQECRRQETSDVVLDAEDWGNNQKYIKKLIFSCEKWKPE